MNIPKGEIQNGKLFYESGALRYEGSYIAGVYEHSSHSEYYLEGTLYYESGQIWRVGCFQAGGLRNGREYYPSGQLMFEGKYNDKVTGSYYGPAYPLIGKFYLEDGTLLYDGNVRVTHRGSVAYPYVVIPGGELFLK